MRPARRRLAELRHAVGCAHSLLRQLEARTGSPNAAAIADGSSQIEALEKRFSGVDNYLAQLNVCQRKWVYLEPIFMRGALPQELGRFRRVDEEYRGIACGIGADQKAVSYTHLTLPTIYSV